MKIKIQKTSKSQSFPLVIPFSDNDKLNNQLSALARKYKLSVKNPGQDFSAKSGQQQMIYTPQGKRVILLGLGKTPGLGGVSNAIKKWVFANKSTLPSSLRIAFDHGNAPLKKSETMAWMEGIVQGAILGRYDVGLYKTDKNKKEGFAGIRTNLTLQVSDKQYGFAKASVARAEAIAKTQSRILDLVNAPGNKVKPSALASWAKASGKSHGFKVRVLNKSQIIKTGLDALLAVNRGSEWPPAFIIMEYIPRIKKRVPQIGLVGKGVTFDTGGLSIKDSSNMHYMKSDMGGAAAVLGTMEACAKLQLPVHLVGIVPTTDNCVDAAAIKPGDVIGSYSGKTIEVIDTDAEGRLILADGLAYMRKNFGPEVMIDLATLTGSAVRTFGYHAGALFSKNDSLAKDLYDSGQESGERLWRLPLWDDYKEDIESDVADVRNFSGKPIAGAISAAKFLEVFTDEHPAWAHLDIAGMAFGATGLAKMKSATGYGIRLLVTYLENASK